MDETLGVAVAPKVILPPSCCWLAKSRTRTSSPFHDLGEFDGIKYITMPYIEGVNFEEVLASTRLTIACALALAR